VVNRLLLSVTRFTVGQFFTSRPNLPYNQVGGRHLSAESSPSVHPIVAESEERVLPVSDSFDQEMTDQAGISLGPGQPDNYPFHWPRAGKDSYFPSRNNPV